MFSDEHFSCFEEEEVGFAGYHQYLHVPDNSAFGCPLLPATALLDCNGKESSNHNHNHNHNHNTSASCCMELDVDALFDVADHLQHHSADMVDESPDADLEDRDWFSSAEHHEAILLFFRAFDADGDGFLSPTEVLAFFQHLNPELQDGCEFRNSFERIDLDGDGRISLDEFLVFADQLFSGEDLDNVLQVHTVFCLYDRNGSGSISREDVARTYMERESKQATQDMLNSFFELVDVDQDGIISWPEFLMAAICNFDFFEEYYCSEMQVQQEQQDEE